MTALLELQHGFRDAILRDAPPPVDILGGRVTAEARIGIYRNNVFGNLTTALRLTYPAIDRLVGEAFFTAAAARFIAATPPAGADLYEYGDGFAAFLDEFEPAMALPYLADVARLEWAVVRALHAVPAEPLDPAALAAFPPDRQAEIVFTPHPTLSLLAPETPARAIWEAVLIADPGERAAALSAIDPSGAGETLAVLRPGDTLVVMALRPTAFALARSLATGDCLGDALGRLEPEAAPSALATLLHLGLFATADDAGDRC